MITEVQERLMSGHLSTSEVNGSVLYHQVVNVPVIGQIVQCPVSPGLLTFVLQGPISNSGPVYIGGSTVGRTGTATELYVTADNASDKLVIFGVA